MPMRPEFDPRAIVPRRANTAALDGLALLEDLFRGVSRTAPALPDVSNQPSQAAAESEGLNINTPQIKDLLGNRGSRSGGRGSLFG